MATTQPAPQIFPGGKQNTEGTETSGDDKELYPCESAPATSTMGRFLRLVSASLRKHRLLLATFVVGFALGRMGERQNVRRIVAAQYERVTAHNTWFLATLLVGLFFREFWKGIPAWLRRQLVPWRQKTERHGTRSVEESCDMTSLNTLTSKLQSLFQLASEKMSLTFDDDRKDTGAQVESNNLEAALVVYLRLLRKIQHYRPDVRNRVYIEEMEGMEAKRDLLQNMDVTFELADMAYNEFSDEITLREALAEHGYHLLRHDAVNLPGSVAHYVALDRSEKVAVISVKGTSSLEDFLTDCCGVAVTETLSQPLGNRTEISCHDGILTASKRLLDDVLPLVEDLLLPSGFRIVVTGHSLGAGVAALVGILLRTRLSLTDEQLTVVAFASPPIVDSHTAIAAASFVTTVVNKADIIPRSSLANLAVLKYILAATIHPRMQERGLVPQDFTSTRALMQYLFIDDAYDDDENGKPEDAWIVRPDEVATLVGQAMDKVPIDDPDHLYVPGRVLLMYSLWKGGEVELDSDNESNLVDGVQEILPTSKALRFFEIDVSMVTDHLVHGYRSSIKGLLENKTV